MKYQEQGWMYIMTDFTDEEEQLTDDYCPICGNPMVIEYGIPVCYYCGYSPDEGNE